MFIIGLEQSNYFILPPKVNWNQQSVGNMLFGRWAAWHEPATRTCSPKSQPRPKLNKKECDQQAEAADSSPPSHFGETHLEYCIQLWRPPHKKDMSESREGPWWLKEHLCFAYRQSGFSTWRGLQEGFIAA